MSNLTQHTEELLTVKEVSKLAGVSVQSVYKRLNNSLKPYVKLVEQQKMIHIKALEEIYNMEVDKPLNQPMNNQLNLNSEVEFLREQIKHLQNELEKEREHNREKDKQLLETFTKLADSQVALTTGQTADKQKALAETLIEGQQQLITDGESQKEKTKKQQSFWSRLFGNKENNQDNEPQKE